MNKSTAQRRTQAQRREETRQAGLDSACQLFGEKGYSRTSLEEIAADCGLTIRPIYHYFGNKKALFSAVNEVMEQRILDTLDDAAGQPGQKSRAWQAYLKLCEDRASGRSFLSMALLYWAGTVGKTAR